MTISRSVDQLAARFVLLVAACLVSVATWAQGENGSASVDTEEELRTYVEVNTDKMVDRLDEVREAHATDSTEFYRIMEQELTNFVDFRRIAARVMARYARQATPEQRDAFVEKFKRSLFDTYAKALADTHDFTIEVDSARFIGDKRDRASVDLTVRSESGEPYAVAYSLYRNNEDHWLMENVIVEGVNIGLAFRDRFQQEIEKNRGNLQAVIDNWSGEVEGLEQKVKEGDSEGADSGA